MPRLPSSAIIACWRTSETIPKQEGRAEGETDAGLFAVNPDQNAADDRSQGHRDPPDEGMDRYPHRPLFLRERPGDEAHRCGEREGRPGEEEGGADEDGEPVGEDDDNEIAEHGDEVEDDQRPFVAETVAQVAAGKGVEGGEEVVHPVQEADRQDAAPEGEQVDRQEPFGHLFAEADEDRHEQERHDAFSESEEIDDPPAPGHFLMLPLSEIVRRIH